MLCLGPLSVLPDYQRQGIGGRLIGRIREAARGMGFRAVLLYGDPDYYLFQGFVPAEVSGIRTADDMYAMALHVCELYDGALEGIAGRFVEDAVFEVDETAAGVFDRAFPAREKVAGTPSQQRFGVIVSARRPKE